MDAHLLIETSGRGGAVGLVRNGAVVQEARLDESRRHARDLSLNVKQLLERESLKPADVASVIVSIGPGSFTGLRVGLASAKAFAYAMNCPLVPVPTFHAIAETMSEDVTCVDVVADALQGLMYVQRFEREVRWRNLDDLRIMSISEWKPDVTVTGPGANLVDGPRRMVLEKPSLEGLWKASLGIPPLSRETVFALEPLYLRGSSAEEKRKASR